MFSFESNWSLKSVVFLIWRGNCRLDLVVISGCTSSPWSCGSDLAFFKYGCSNVFWTFCRYLPSSLFLSSSSFYLLLISFNYSPLSYSVSFSADVVRSRSFSKFCFC